ncbi:MAG: response regulator [Holophagales bacterium]|nr:response regulator [Holophagales bacterium]
MNLKELSDCRVLIVDDVRSDVQLIAGELKGEYKISVALDGESAMKAVAASQPDIVLLDIVMPGLDGYEVLRRLRAEPGTRDLPVMFLSSLEDVADKARGFELGANDYLTKPFEVLEVRARVRSLLKAKAYSDAVKAALERDLPGSPGRSSSGSSPPS